MVLAEKVRRIMALDDKIDDLRAKKLKPLEDEKAKLRVEVMDEVKEKNKELAGGIEGAQITVRLPFANVILTTKRTLQVISESAVVKYIKRQGMEKDYVAERLTDLFYESYLKQLQKEGGVIPGTEMRETEHIRISPSEKSKVK